MKTRRTGILWLAVRAAALLLTLPTQAAPATEPALPIEALTRLDEVRKLDDLSQELWPDWDVSNAPFALYRPGECCYLIHHRDPPDGFERVRGRLPVRGRVYTGSASDPEVAPATGILGGEPTAYLDLHEFAEQPLPAAFREAFRAHNAKHCGGMTEPVDLLEGYPFEPQNLVLADIECDLLMQAVRAPAESLEQRTLDFLAVRTVRRIGILGDAVHYERWLERCRAEAAAFLDDDSRQTLSAGLGGPGCFEACARSEGTLDWYARDRFACTGAAICMLLDRQAPGWKRQVEEDCVEPYEVLREMLRTRIPRASEVLERYDVDARVAEKQAFVDGTKSEPERLFEEITEGGYPTLTVDTHLLASSQVSYDPENIVEVDEHRAVHQRVIRIEYSGDTHVYVIGRPVATVTGEGEFDIERLIMTAPEELRVTVGGEPLELTRGVHQITEHLSVDGGGVSIEAAAGIVMVGEAGVTFMLHR
jgi:hypothetical protein